MRLLRFTRNDKDLRLLHSVRNELINNVSTGTKKRRKIIEISYRWHYGVLKIWNMETG